ncbi:PIN domain-containing protein [Microtetraspora malaysiensis]|uniref:PIN domain-containing protein n=1 Tax=Microtetraspora malaysiensis TaxID=161358 RepID=A0ABW6T4U8_9ACTN
MLGLPATDEQLADTALIQLSWEEPEFFAGVFDRHAPLLHRYAAREYGQLWTAVIASGRNPRPRPADLMIACVAIANRLPLYTCNPKDFKGLDHLLTVAPVTRPRWDDM